MYREATLYYFSGTGNARNTSVWIADELLTAGIPTTLVSIDQLDPHTIQSPAENSLTGFIAPTHGFHFPEIMRKFMRRFPPASHADAFVVNTRAGLRVGSIFLPGLSGVLHYWSFFVLKRKGFRVKGLRPVDLPSNWLLLHPAVRKKGVQAIYEHVEPRVRAFGKKMGEGKKDYPALRDVIQDALIAPVSLAYNLAGKYFFSKSLFASDKCTRCGVCLDICPVKAIREVNGRMFWTSGCEGCMRCVNKCPERAIETGHGLVLTVILFSILAIAGISYLLSAAGIRKHLSLLENGWIYLGLLSIVVFPVLFGFYRLNHWLMRFSFFASLASRTSLSRYRFWGRYRPPLSKPK